MDTPAPPLARIEEIGGRGSRAWTLGETTVTVGRGENCQIALPDRMASREHAQLVWRRDGWWVEDLGSTNGTLVNGVRVTARLLASGDRIRIGATDLEFRLPTSPASPVEQTSRSTPEPAPMPRTRGGRRVFVSYARTDAALVDLLVRGLERRGHEVWIDREDIRGGQAWAASIVDAIELSDVAILVLTAASVQSPEVLKEVHLAAGRRLPLVPVVLSPVKISKEIQYHIAGRQQVSVDRDSPSEAVRPLVEAVEGSETQGQRRRRHSLAVAGIAAVIIAAIAGGGATIVRGTFPPWEQTPACDSIELASRGARPSTFVDLSGAVLDLRFRNRSSRDVSIPPARDVVVRGADGFTYREEPGLVRSGEWFFGTTINPGAALELQLGIAAPASRGTRDVLAIEVPGARERLLPFLRCDLVLRGVGATFPG